MGEKETQTVEETTTNVDSTGMEEKQTEVKETAEEKEVEKTKETSTPVSEETTSKDEETQTVGEDNKTSDSEEKAEETSDTTADELQQLRNENIKLKTAREHNLDDEALKILGEVDDTYPTRAKALANLLNKPESKETKRDPNIGATGAKMWDGNSWLRDTIGA